MSAALQQNLDLLRQGIDLLRRIEDEIYQADEIPHETSYKVGPHVRHCIDAYGCLLDGLSQRQVDYDARQRRAEIELDRQQGLEALERIAADLESHGDIDPHTELRVKVDTPSDVPGAWSRSTLRRELQFLVGHTVHHYALIGLILRRHGVDPGHEFGVAPSTLRHWSREESLIG